MLNKMKTKTLLFPLLGASLLMAGTPGEAGDPGYQAVLIDEGLSGAAFVVEANVRSGSKPELIVSGFGPVSVGPMGPVISDSGTVTIYSGAYRGYADKKERSKAIKHVVVGENELITFPNRAQPALINDDKHVDIIVPGGYFFDTSIGQARGSLTWWENQQDGTRWVRHDIVTGSPFSYHSAVLEDFDGDGIGDIASVAEDAGVASNPFDDVLELHIFYGVGDGTFAPAATAGLGGGGLIEAYDVDGDGDMDIVSPQFFGDVAGQPFIPLAARNADSASFVWFENLGGGVFSKHAIGLDQGPGFMITAVEDLLGDGITRWVATNHTNPNVTFRPFSLYPQPAVYEFTPGVDPRQPWNVRQLTPAGAFPVTGGVGQAAPGSIAAGDLNDDDRIDLAVSGDGARGLYWMEQKADGSFVTRQLPGSEGWGQAGGPVITNLGGNKKNEIGFGRFDLDSLGYWKR